MLGNFVKSFDGLNSAESSTLFHLLQNRITRLENTIRWTWQPGDVAMWDNRATQHYAVADFGSEPREMRRITVAGDVPVAIDGRHSEVLRGRRGGLLPPRRADQLTRGAARPGVGRLSPSRAGTPRTSPRG